MNTVEKDFSLTKFNTFGIEAKAKYFASFDSTEALQSLLNDDGLKNENKLFLGGGSNILFCTDYFNGIVLHNKISGIQLIEEKENHVLVCSGAGESWHTFVLHTLEKGWYGLENLSLIPGTVGAAPMQNIGAYGIEIKDVFEWLEAYELATGKLVRFDLTQCQFGYRSSYFKHEGKGKYCITKVCFRLSKTPTFNISYGAISDTLKEMNVTTLTAKAISDAVIKIRRSKLPDPAEIGNAGSFFKNPEIPAAQFNLLKSSYPTLPSYPTSPGYTKVPAGWLIEQCGWKGKIIGEAGVHRHQALVIVNYGNAKGNDIKKLSIDIQQSVEAKFGIKLEAEVNFIE